jgi:hypothetical protein
MERGRLPGIVQLPNDFTAERRSKAQSLPCITCVRLVQKRWKTCGQHGDKT